MRKLQKVFAVLSRISPHSPVINNECNKAIKWQQKSLQSRFGLTAPGRAMEKLFCFELLQKGRK